MLHPLCYQATWIDGQLRVCHIPDDSEYLSNRTPFLRVYRRDKPTRDVGRTREKLVNHEPQAGFYCFYEITTISVCKERTLL